MLLKNVGSQGIYLYCYVISTGLPATGGSANITGYWCLDGGTPTVFGTTNPTELSSTHMPGVYWQPLAQGETNGNAVAFAWKSSTSGNAINTVVVPTTGVSVPAVAFAGANGLVTAGTGTGQISLSSGNVSLAATPPTAAAIATAVWEDTTAGGDFGTAGSIGLLLVTDVNATISSRLATSGYAAPPTTAQIATAIWEDTTAGGDFGTARSIGKLIVTTGLTVLAVTNGATVTTNNDKTGYSLTVAPPTAAAIATSVWKDTTAGGDFGTAGSIGLLLVTDIDTTVSSRLATAGYTTPPTVAAIATGVWEDTTAGGDFGTAGSIGKLIVTTGAPISLTQVLGAARAVDPVADTSLAVNDALQCAVGSISAQMDASGGTTLVVKTASTGTTLRTKTLTLISPPATVPDKAV